MQTEKDYEELLRLFNKNKVKYCVVGAFAMAMHSIPRYTKDFDILIEPSDENAERVLNSLQEFGFKSLKLDSNDFSVPNKVIQLGYAPLRIDLLTSIDGVDFKRIWRNKITSFYGKQRVHFIGLNELVLNKKATQRTQDKADIELINKHLKNIKKN